MTSNS